jgi:hypothetical protein
VFGSIAGVAGLAAGGTMLVVSHRAAGPAAVISSQMITITSAQPAEEDRKTFATRVDEKTKVRFLGVSKFPPHEESWFTIAGEPADPPPLPANARPGESNVPPEFQAVFEITKPRDVVVMLQVHDGMMVMNNNSNTEGDRGGEMFIVSSFTLQGPRKTADFTLGFSTQGWQTVGTFDAPGADEGGIDTDQHGHFQFAPVREDDQGRAVVEVTHAESREPLRIAAIDEAGKEVISNHVNVNGDGDTCTGTYTFELKPERVKKLAVQARKFDKVMEVQDVSLSPDNPTEPKISVRDAD